MDAPSSIGLFLLFGDSISASRCHSNRARALVRERFSEPTWRNIASSLRRRLSETLEHCRRLSESRNRAHSIIYVEHRVVDALPANPGTSSQIPRAFCREQMPEMSLDGSVLIVSDIHATPQPLYDCLRAEAGVSARIS